MSQNHAWFKKHPWIKHFNMTEYENISIRFLISYCKKPLRNYAWWVLGYYPKTVSTKIRKWKSLSHVWLWGPMECSPWNSPGQNTGVGNFSFSRGSSQPQGLNPGLPTSRQILYEPQGKPKNTAVGSLSLLQQIFLTRNWTRVSCITGRFFTNWAMREVLEPDRIYEIIIFFLFNLWSEIGQTGSWYSKPDRNFFRPSSLS